MRGLAAERPLVRLTVACYGTTVVAGIALAVVVRLLCAPSVKAWLGFTFPGVPATFGEALQIFRANLPLIMGGLAAALAVGWRGVDAEASAPWRGVRLVCDLIVGLIVARNVVVVGAAVGAYGVPMVRVLLPHGPLELLSLCLLLALYLQARRTPLAVAQALRVVAVAAAMLALAALLEAFGGGL